MAAPADGFPIARSDISDPFDDSDSPLSDVPDEMEVDEPARPGNGVEEEVFLSDHSDSEMSHVSEEEDDDFDATETVKGRAANQRKAAAAAKKSEAAAKKAAAGAKTVPFDTVVIPMGGDKTQIEKLISWRRKDDGREEIMVKYKNMSYIHAEWLPRADVEASRLGKMRVKRFLDKPTWDNQWSEEEPFNPSFKLIDRLLDEGELGEGEIYYLVKWRAQTYDTATWESSSLVAELDAEKIPEFNKRRVLTVQKERSYLAPPRRPLPKDWRKMDDSPSYKNDMQLRPYQLEGLNWLLFCWYNRQNSILADEMGLGKTVQSTVFLDYMYTRENFCGPFLIVTPLSTIGNWEREIKTWTEMNVVVYHGRDTARNLIVETEFYYRDSQGNPTTGIYKFDIILTTYEMAMSGAAQLRPIPWRCVVLDEAHRLKNKTSKVSEILKTYSMEHRVLLTGTPLQNSLDELWALLNFLQPERFASEADFQTEYGSLSTAADVEKLQGLLKPLMLRRMKEDVEKSIPVKEETIVEVELTTVQKKWYRSILEKNFAWLKQGSKRNNVPNLINTMIELRKCCIHPFLLKGAEDQIMKEKPADTVEQHFQALIQASGKMVLIDKLLVKLRAGGHKVLIFSQMTRCLDIIQDYLRGRQWAFERIDGGVRGDLRQAAIDRFSAPESDTFVFLLCTRAGGVGINLTAADTCIIFDSDWNPQNDLQAQSRVHRIGQKRPVQIYRLITRNTYEREMFDRASMKLGLDKAILQRMDGDPSGIEGFDASKPPSSMSKTEIEELLKKGAYGAMLDDEASNSFCDEDIDSILSRRTQVIKHDQPAAQSEKGSIFSKATFSAANADNVDINDPDFWDKMAQRAKLDVVDTIPEVDLVLDLPRQRRQVQRFGASSRGSPMGPSDDGDVSAHFVSRGPGDVIKPWAQAEKTRLERAMMVHGFSGWDTMVEDVLNRRVAEDVRACARAMVIHALQRNPTLDAETLSDVKGAINQEGDVLIEEPPHVIPEVPYPNATRRQIAEYRSFLIDAPPEYHDHLDKRAKNMLSRISMMHCIRTRIAPTKDTPMPRVPGAPPADWWGPKEDLHLLIGIAKYGYQQYDRTRLDPDLCFFEQAFADLPAGLLDVKSTKEEDDDDDPQDDDEQEEGAPIRNATPAGSEAPSGAATPSLTHTQPQQHNANGLRFPTPSDLGFRLRRILAAFQKQMSASARESVRKQAADEKTRQKTEKEQERARLKEHDFTRKEKQEFQRTLLSFGVEDGPDGKRSWLRFQELCNIKKSVETLEHHFLKLMSICDEVIKTEEGAENGESLKKEKPDAEKEDKTGDVDQVNYARAKKIVNHIEQMRLLRGQVLSQPKLEERLQVIKRQARSGLPHWWTSEYDRHFLIGVAKWGLNRSDLIIEDPTSVFFDLHKEFLTSLTIRADKQIPSDELVDGRWEDKFWMREPVALRRFEILVDAALREEPKKRSRRKPAVSPDLMDESRTPIRETSAVPIASASTGKVRSLKLKFEKPEAPSRDETASPPAKRKRSSRSSKREEKSEKSSRHKRRAESRSPARGVEDMDIDPPMGGSSGDDTDAMLRAAQQKTEKRKRKRRETHDGVSSVARDEDFKERDRDSPAPRSSRSRGASPSDGPERKKHKHKKSKHHRGSSSKHRRRHHDGSDSQGDGSGDEGSRRSKHRRRRETGRGDDQMQLSENGHACPLHETPSSPARNSQTPAAVSRQSVEGSHDSPRAGSQTLPVVTEPSNKSTHEHHTSTSVPTNDHDESPVTSRSSSRKPTGTKSQFSPPAAPSDVVSHATPSLADLIGVPSPAALSPVVQATSPRVASLPPVSEPAPSDV
ncbi:choline dehydrogenase 7 [Thoreauomyces humboldtii]|nr:choline dehydrogenase 7 [Thoreauomyces humboldtii]